MCRNYLNYVDIERNVCIDHIVHVQEHLATRRYVFFRLGHVCVFHRKHSTNLFRDLYEYEMHVEIVRDDRLIN